MSVPEILKACPLFYEMFESEISLVIEHCKIYQYNRGEYVLRQGDTGEEIYVLLEGKTSVERVTDAGRVSIQTLESGDVFGELCIIGEKVRQADILTVDVCAVLEITYENIFYLFQKKPRVFSIIMLNIARLLTKRLSSSNQIIVNLYEKLKNLETMKP